MAFTFWTHTAFDTNEMRETVHSNVKTEAQFLLNRIGSTLCGSVIWRKSLKTSNRITFAETCNRKDKANPEHNAEEPKKQVLSQYR